MKTYRTHDVENRGHIERVSYVIKDAAGEAVKKYANVYLPAGYETSGQKYNVLYVMHGGGGNPDAWLDSSCIKNILDFSFSEKEADPFIVVFPTYYVRGAKADKLGAPGVPGGDGDQTKIFQQELREIVIPLVETTYRTYAEDVTLSGLEASRKHRAFSGFSMGGSTTWFAFTENLKLIADFVPLSGDCWALETMGGKLRTAETVQYLIDVVKKSGLTKADYKIFAATGVEDIANPNLTPQVEEMKKFPEYFDFSEDFAQGNFHYILQEGYEHAYPRVAEYLYNYIPFLFRY